MNLHDPLIIALIKTYAKHQWFFRDQYFVRFRLITEWLTEESTGYRYIPDSPSCPLPWYAYNNEIAKLAEILKVSRGELYQVIREIENEPK